MYEISREGNRVVVKKGTVVALNAVESSYVVYKSADGMLQVSKLSDLNDVQLLLALANAVELKT